jgi:Domain of unknown function (DUF4347)
MADKEKPCDTFTVIESKIDPGDDGKFIRDAMKAKENRGAIIADSVEDMVTKILKRLDENKNNCNCIKLLRIIAHGSPGSISVGNGRFGKDDDKLINSKEEKGIITTNQKSWEPHLKKLKGKFCKKGEIEFLSCYFGAGEAGRQKLQAVAKVTGTKASGYNTVIKPGGEPASQTDKRFRKVTADPDDKNPPPKADAFESSRSRLSPGKPPMRALQITPPRAMAIVSGKVEFVPSLEGLPPACIIDDPDAIQAMLLQINTLRTIDVGGMGGTVDARLLVQKSDGSNEAYQLREDYFHIGSGRHLSRFHRVSDIGRQWFRQLALAHEKAVAR